MPAESFEFRISFRRLLIGLLVTVVPISVVALYAITKSDKELQRTIGTHFKIFAESTAKEISDFIHERVIQVGGIATAPAVVRVVEEANRSYAGMSEAAITDRIQRIEEGWNGAAAEAVVRRILSSPASAWLRRCQELDPRILRVTVTDARGATVAATHKTLDYFQADEEYWQAIYAEGRGAVNITDVLYDDVTRSSYIGVGVPILEAGTNRFIGTVDALVDVSSLFAFVNQPHPPLNLHVSLVKEDGTVIAAPEANLAMKMTSPELLAVQDSLQSIGGRQTGYLVTPVPELGRRLIGFADTGLKEDYRNLSWVVLVSQDAREAFASIRLVGRLTAFLALVGLAMVVMLVAYFSLHRREPFEDLHPMSEAPQGGRGA